MTNYIDGSFSNGINLYMEREPEFPSSPSSSTTTVRGGVTSIQFGVGDQGGITDDFAPDVRDLGSRVRTGDERYVWNSFGGEVRQAGVSSINTADFSADLPGVLSTVQSSSLRPVTHANLQPSDTIEVDGVRFTLEIAEQIGIVTRDQNGRYVEAALPRSGAQAPAQARQEAIEAPVVGEAFSPSAEAGLAALVQATTPDTQIAVFDEFVRTGDVSEANIGRLASEAGIEPREAARWVQGILGEFEAQSAKALAKMGVMDTDHFGAWLAQNGRQSEASKALYQHITNRTTAGYAPLAEQYVLTMDQHSPDLIMSASFSDGVRVVRGNDGRPVLQIEGATYSWASAVRAGLVRVS